MFEEALKTVIHFLSMGVESAAALLIGAGTLEALGNTAKTGFKPGDHTGIRLRLGRWLALSLEFLLAADILRTAVAPTWNDIGQLAAIAAIRTSLNYFLEREMGRAAPHDAQA